MRAVPRTFVRVAVGWAALALLSACAGKAGLSEDEKLRAAKLYDEKCAACHDNGQTGAPNRAALETRTAATILASLETGLMREQGKALTLEERRLIAAYFGASAADIAARQCDGRFTPGGPVWNRWGNGLENRRFQAAAAGGITPANVGTLELKWAFGFPGAARARSQPAVSENAIFIGSQDGRVYALDDETGCIWWSFEADSEVRGAPTLGTDATGKVDQLYFGDFAANAYAVDAQSGKLVWKASVKDHAAGTITGSVTIHNGHVYVPMSSTEVVSAMDGSYGCCTFRGGIMALNAKDGSKVWRMYTTDSARENGKNRTGVPAFGPSGAPVWSPPTIDAKRRLLYIGTGENYSSPANDRSDAIIALELATGRVRWVRQVRSGDAWNASCGTLGNNINCPKEDGPDLDFGAPPILATLANGRDIVLAGQKSGLVFGIDPDSGRILWRQRAGAGGFNGGIHWGMASDGRTLFVGIADTPGNKGAVGPRRPGLHAFDAATGLPLWSLIETQTCPERAFACETALSAPVTLTEGIVFAGAHNGLLRAYATQNGKPLWSFDTRRAFPTVNGVKGTGGSIDSAGPVIAGGRLIVNSGYDKFGEIPGNVLLVFGPKTARDGE
jgi:polyvinyl alcohol dehydrogenase (cytochrome)